ncbi:hypothetical protein DD568_23995, partial [Klebsiella pneumoniae]
LDPYCMMLERVTTYLQAIEDETRLDLVRRCFYLHAAERRRDRIHEHAAAGGAGASWPWRYR